MKNLCSIVLVVSLATLCFSRCRNPEKPPEKPPYDWPRYNYTESAWSPDGNFIAYEYGGNPYGTDTAGIFIFDPRDSTSRYLIHGMNPDWSPDGEWIVFGEHAGIWKIKVNGDSLTQLTFNGNTFFPDWSPNGKNIAYDCTTDPPGYGIWIMNADGTDKKSLGLGRNPDWSPSGSKFVYEGGPGPTKAASQIWVADTNGANTSQLTFQAITNRCPAWSPDGSKIAFSSSVEEQGPRIWIMDADGGNLKKITEEGGDIPSWSPDGSKIAYTNTKLGEIWVMEPDGTGKRKLIGYPDTTKGGKNVK